MEDQQRAQLIVANSTHYLDLVLTMANQSPKAEIKAEEIYKPTDADFAAIHLPDQEEAPAREIAFFKWNGKYIVLLGREKARKALDANQAVLKGRIVSKPALKRCRVDEYQPRVMEPEEEPRNRSGNQHISRPYHGEFRNAPRIVDKRRSPAEEHYRNGNSTTRNSTSGSGRSYGSDSTTTQRPDSRPPRPQYPRSEGQGTNQTREQSAPRKTGGGAGLYGQNRTRTSKP